MHIDMLLRLLKATERASGVFLLLIHWGSLGEIMGMRHPIEKVFRSAPTLPKGHCFGFCESCNQRRIVPTSPSRLFISILLHIPLLGVLPEVVSLGQL